MTGVESVVSCIKDGCLHWSYVSLRLCLTYDVDGWWSVVLHVNHSAADDVASAFVHGDLVDVTVVDATVGVYFGWSVSLAFRCFPTE